MALQFDRMWFPETGVADDIWDNVQGVYKLPWDMTTYGHRQYDPLFVLTK